MASILDKYGIKEVADVTFYKINPDTEEAAQPVLYLDTLKVSTIEQTAEEAEARGGKGNPPLIIWDYGKEITVTLEDALFSAKSMAIMFSGNESVETSTSHPLLKTVPVEQLVYSTTNTAFEVELGNKTVTIPSTGATWYDATGSTTAAPTDASSLKASTAAYVTWNQPVDASIIEISAQTFPGTYYVTGDTYARKQSDGTDEFFQFIIPKAKVQSENTITLEAEGDPSVFNLNLRVLRPKDGVMMKLVKYDLGDG